MTLLNPCGYVPPKYIGLFQVFSRLFFYSAKHRLDLGGIVVQRGVQRPVDVYSRRPLQHLSPWRYLAPTPKSCCAPRITISSRMESKVFYAVTERGKISECDKLGTREGVSDGASDML